MTDPSELRASDRFVAAERLNGFFGSTSVTIIDLGENGAQIEHGHPLRLGSSGRFVFHRADVAVAVDAIAIWSHLSRMPDYRGKYLYRSGLRVDGPPGALAEAVQQLTRARMLLPDNESLARKQLHVDAKQAARSRRPHVRKLRADHDIPTDQILLIEHARTRLRGDPKEAMKWYNRVRFALNEEANKGMAESLRHREDVLAVWEYLERSIDVNTIVRVFERQK